MDIYFIGFKQLKRDKRNITNLQRRICKGECLPDLIGGGVGAASCLTLAR